MPLLAHFALRPSAGLAQQELVEGHAAQGVHVGQQLVDAGGVPQPSSRPLTPRLAGQAADEPMGMSSICRLAGAAAPPWGAASSPPLAGGPAAEAANADCMPLLKLDDSARASAGRIHGDNTSALLQYMYSGLLRRDTCCGEASRRWTD